MDEYVETAVIQVKELLGSAMFATMATVNMDGTPHNSPFFFMHDDKLKHIYWGSHSGSVHSQNILRTGELYVVLYNSHKYSPGLYIKSKNGKVVKGDELKTALEIHNKFRGNYGKSPIEIEYYKNGPQDMWSAEVEKLWINGRDENEEGRLVKDIRIEISPNQLIK